MTDRTESERGRADSERLARLQRDRERAEVDRDREPAQRDHGRSEKERGTSWASVVLGLLAALGAGVILSGIVGGIVGAILGGGDSAATEGGAASLIGLLVTLLIAYTIGGYAAGRLASRSGLKHGVFVPLLGLALIIVLGVLGAAVGLSFLDNLSGVALPSAPNDAPQNIGTILSVTGLLGLAFTFLGGALGGAWGARTGRRRGFVGTRG